MPIHTNVLLFLRYHALSEIRRNKISRTEKKLAVNEVAFYYFFNCFQKEIIHHKTEKKHPKKVFA